MINNGEKIKITRTDQVLLTVLESDARIADTVLARKCRKSKDTVKYRIARLERLGVIRGYGALIDYTKLGAMNYKVYIQASNPQGIIAFVDGLPQVFARFTAYADWNLGVAFFCRTPQEYYSLESGLFARFGKDIKQLTLCHMVDARIFGSRAFGNAHRQTDIFGGIANNTLDATDRELLGALLADGRQSFVTLASRLKTSVNTVRRRMAALERSGVIVAYTTAIDHAKLGYESYKLFITVQNYAPQMERSLLETLSQTTQCRNYARMLGPWKVEAEFLCKDYDEFHAIMRALRQHPAVLGLRYAIFRGETYYPSRTVI